MKKRAFLSLILVVLMTLPLIAGCATTQPAAQTATEQAPAAPAAAAAAPAESPTDAEGSSYKLTTPVTIVLASQGTGTNDYITTALESQYFTQNLPDGSNVTHETISTGCSSLGYLLEAGLADFGTGQNAMSATVGLEGKPAFSAVSALMATKKYAFVAQIVNNDFIKKTGYTSLREVVENKYPARICAEPIGSSDYVSLIYMLDILGSSVEEIESWGGSVTFTGGSACCDMLQDGQADIMVGHMTDSSSSIVELCMSSDVQAYSVDQGIIDGLIERGYATVMIPKGTYNRFTEDTPSATQASSKIVPSAMSNELAYALTKILCENKDALGEELTGYRGLTYKEMVDTNATVVPLHPGAIAYYQDIGVLDANGQYIGEPSN
jgi:TRAP transporter TAXI family solute receptor